MEFVEHTLEAAVPIVRTACNATSDDECVLASIVAIDDQDLIIRSGCAGSNLSIAGSFISICERAGQDCAVSEDADMLLDGVAKAAIQCRRYLLENKN